MLRNISQFPHPSGFSSGTDQFNIMFEVIFSTVGRIQFRRCVTQHHIFGSQAQCLIEVYMYFHCSKSPYANRTIYIHFLLCIYIYIYTHTHIVLHVLASLHDSCCLINKLACCQAFDDGKK
jgi:hypothetical protein